MGALYIDPHAHLYSAYSIQSWCEAALGHLGSGGLVVVVDRQGQDSLTRLAQEVEGFALWREHSAGISGAVEWPSGESITVVRGVQYVARERIEVLGLGVGRACNDGEPVETLISLIGQGGGIACLPWSPGKWLGARGKLVGELLARHKPSDFVVGDISVRSSIGPYSPLLQRAKEMGFSVLCGTDPLPRVGDQSLVGTFGMVIDGEPPAPADERVPWVLDRLKTAQGLTPHGRRNGPLLALRRFVSAFL
jgi:hypothetical protein